MSTPRSAWKPGQSGNPKGKPRGSRNGSPGLRTLTRGQIAPHVPKLVDKALQMAEGGDVAAIRMLLDRTIPTLKSVAVPTPFPVAPGASLPDQGRAVLDAIAAGTLAPDVGATILSGLATLARIVADAPPPPQEPRTFRFLIERGADTGKDSEFDEWPRPVGTVTALPAVRG